MKKSYNSMLTYQDLLAVGESDQGKSEFIANAIEQYKVGRLYTTALEADQYVRQLNPTIMGYQKLLYTISGKAVPDNYSANHKCASNFFNRFVTQECQYLLGNGVQFENDKTKEKLGKNIDTQLQKAGKAALIGGVAYGFFNLDHIEVFKATEFVPLWDEENGSLMAGVRFWQIAPDKPVRATLFEIDGYTDYIKRADGQKYEIYKPKRSYKQIVKYSVADGAEIFDGGNYPGFPIVPVWGNPNHQSELVGIKGQIDAYDLIKSGFANDLDDASMIYWTLENCGGMDDVDLVKFVERMKTVKAAVVDGDTGAKAEAHTIDVPYQSRETYLSRLEADLYHDAMALDVNSISGGNITATAIRAAYEPLNNKTDQFEYCLVEFIQAILALLNIDDAPTFKRSMIANMTEETQMVLSAGSVLDNETIIRHLPWLTPDEIDGALERAEIEEGQRYRMYNNQEGQYEQERLQELTGRNPGAEAE